MSSICHPHVIHMPYHPRAVWPCAPTPLGLHNIHYVRGSPDCPSGFPFRSGSADCPSGLPFRSGSVDCPSAHGEVVKHVRTSFETLMVHMPPGQPSKPGGRSRAEEGAGRDAPFRQIRISAPNEATTKSLSSRTAWVVCRFGRCVKIRPWHQSRSSGALLSPSNTNNAGLIGALRQERSCVCVSRRQEGRTPLQLAVWISGDEMPVWPPLKDLGGSRRMGLLSAIAALLVAAGGWPSQALRAVPFPCACAANVGAAALRSNPEPKP